MERDEAPPTPPAPGLGEGFAPREPVAPAPEPLAPGVRFAVYQGSFDALPMFDALAPVATGTSASFDISARAGDDLFAFAFEALLLVDVEGSHTFFTVSDDGSRLMVDGDIVVDNDGVHGAAEQQGSVALGAGLHAIRVEYFEKLGDTTLAVDWAPPGAARAAIPPERLLLDVDRFPPVVVPEPGAPFRFVDSLRGGSAGIVMGGGFDGEGWHVAADTDRIVFDQLPRLSSGFVEFTLTGVSGANLVKNDNEIFAMYEGGYGMVEPVRYSPQFRNNHYKSMLRIYGAEEQGRAGAQKLMWGMCPDGAPGYQTGSACACGGAFFEEPFNGDAEVTTWTGAPERLRIEWGDGRTRYLRNSVVIVDIDWSDVTFPFAPNELHFSLGTSRQESVDSAGLPIGAVFSDLVIEGTPTDDVATCD